MKKKITKTEEKVKTDKEKIYLKIYLKKRTIY